MSDFNPKSGSIKLNDWLNKQKTPDYFNPKSGSIKFPSDFAPRQI